MPSHAHGLPFASSSTSLRGGRRDQWSFLFGLAVGIGMATIIQSLLIGSGGYKGGRPFSFFSSRTFILPRSLAQWQQQSKKGKRPKILLFGDSLTQRGFEGPQQAWAAGLAHAYGRRADIVNRGFSGYTAKWCALMLESLFPPQDPSWEIPVLAVVFLGANDAALPTRDQHVPVYEYEQHLKSIVTYLSDRRRGLDGTRETAVLLLTPPPVDEKRWGEHCEERGRPLDRKNDITRLYARACQSVGREMGVPVIDVWTKLGGEKELSAMAPNLVDGLHLSGKGNQLVLEAVLEAIQTHYPHLSPAELPMQAPEHFEITRDTREIVVA